MTGQAPADQLRYLRSDGYMLRVYGVSPQYAGDVRQIRTAIDRWFTSHAAQLPTDAGVMTQWHLNYQVTLVPSGSRNRTTVHDSMVSGGAGGPIWNRDYAPGTGHLQSALDGWRDQHR